MSELYALLIGVDFYFPNRLPGGGGYGHLGGCVRDVTHVETHLRDRLGLPDRQIFRLTATNNGGQLPIESPQAWPTYANMVSAFKQVTALAQPGDRVYIHYAGHGGRTVTAFPELKSDGLDEGLVPTDIGDAHARYLRDVEMHYLLHALVEKGVVLTVVLDSCHSGGATRAANGEILGALPRGISEIDATPRPEDSLVASHAELAAAWQRQSTPATRAAKSVSGWLLEPQGYTLLAACRANEFAYEYPFNGRERNGALTYWLLDTLRQAGPNFTYKMLHDRILARVHGQFAQQTPMLQGEGDVVVFGAERIKPHFAIPVLRVESNGERVQVNAGEAHGLAAGAQLAIYPALGADFDSTEARIARVEVTAVDAVESWAQVKERYGQGVAIEPGAQALLLGMANVDFQRNVALDIEDDTIHQQMAAAIQSRGGGFVKVAEPNAPVHFVVERTETGEFSIQDAADNPIPNLRPAIQSSDLNAINRVVDRLAHLARFNGVRDLNVLDTGAAQKLKVELIGSAVNQPGDRVGLRVSNSQAPGDDTRILNIAVLALSSDWSIAQIYPAGAAAFHSLSPGETIDLTFEAYLPDGQTESTDVLKVFATQATTNFRWLELPALDQPVTRSVTRSANMNALEQLLASITDESASERVNPTRAVRFVTDGADKAWAVAQVELRVEQRANS